MKNRTEVAVLRRLASELEQRATEREVWIKGQSGFFVQYEDQGQTMSDVHSMRNQAEAYRKEAAELENVV